jgi:hypothetical protein
MSLRKIKSKLNKLKHENGNTPYHDFWDTAKVAIRGSL